MNKKILLFFILSFSVLSLLACNLAVQKTGKAGNGDDEPSPTPSPSCPEISCECNAEPAAKVCERRAKEECSSINEKYVGFSYSVIGAKNDCVPHKGFPPDCEAFCLGDCFCFGECGYRCASSRGSLGEVNSKGVCEVEEPWG